jgi:pimeloyl-ACP methyl ester carboxylesterase
MKRFGRAGLTDGISSLPGQAVGGLRAVALTLLLLGISVGVSTAEKAAPTPPGAPKQQSHVYLLRGAFNIFSLGMDEMATRVQQMGVPTTVTNYLGWESLADEAAAAYKSGRIKNIILIGHSSGATAVTEMAAKLGRLGVPVKLAIGLDPTTHMVATGNVARYVNYYVGGGMGTSVDKGKQFTGTLQNVDMERNRDIGHFNIDKSRAVQDLVIRDIRAAL